MRIWLGIVMLLATTPAFAAMPAEYLRQAEASMLLTGRIEVDAEGKVTAYSLDDEAKLPPEAVIIVRRAAPTWRFKPVLRQGVAVPAGTDMSLRLVASKLDDGSYEATIRSAHFADRPKPGTETDAIDMRPPLYPQKALDARITGTVHLLLKTGPDGSVIDAIAEQVNLSTVTGGRSMDRWRRLLAEASLARAKEWRFRPMPAKERVDFELMRVPVVFSFYHSPNPNGRWEIYIPGPRLPNPWDDDKEGTAFSPDVLLPGQAYRAGIGWQLLTTLSGA